ncbi:hypothetical protein [Cohnella fermenti]|uniref:DUF4328 domain-containing protein n=1 Tax=Cohnella fermenti TaxID=2565925 RepID=A0A4S4C1S9_9BACL|nr:hypothetical protein [Cohnella fermenti]THF81614.1 hypothetical protein E6C55_07735 [Cohnella fermenti]
MKLKSEWLSQLLKILLGILCVFAATDLVCSVAYAIDYDFFVDSLYSLYGFVEILSSIVYYVVLVLFLIWIYRVHMDLNRLFLAYPRTPGGSLAAMMIPFYNFYGIPSTFRIIGSITQDDSEEARVPGRWIFGLAAPLLFFQFGTNLLNRFVSNADQIGSGLLLASSAAQLVLYGIYFALALQISRGLRIVADGQEEKAAQADFLPGDSSSTVQAEG